MNDINARPSTDGSAWTLLAFRSAAIIFVLSSIFFPSNEYKALSITVGLIGVCLLILNWAIEGIKNPIEKYEIHSPPFELQPILDRLDRIATALERGPLANGAVPPRNPGTSEVGRPNVENLLEELKAAQDVADPERVLQIRDELTDRIEGEPLKELDSQLSKWFMALIMKRLRTGHVGPDLAELVGRVSDRFVQTLEGASLRASLPTLRRSAGLCARCSRPYRGISEACPICLAGPPLTSAPSESMEEIEEVEKLTRPEDSPFLDPID